MEFEQEIKKEGSFEYLEKGEGHTIILLHGLFGALSNFKDVIEVFSKKYRIVVPIMPLYTMPIINTGVKSLAKYIEDFIDYKNYDQFTLLGNSLGGHVALVYTKDHLDKVHSLVLTGSSGLYENAFGGSYPRKGDKAYLRDKIAVTFYDPAMATDELVDACHEIVNDRGKLIRILAIAKSAIRHNMADDLPNLKVPTLLIWGKQDQITPPHVAEEFHEALPDSELVWIDKCGHAPMMERPEAFNKALDDWMHKRFNF